MTPAEGAGVPLTTLLTELKTKAAANPGRPAGRKLPGGLHVAALQRNHLTLTTWRTASKPPSVKECEIVARDAGMLLPKVTPFTRPDQIPAFALTDRASSPDQCDHQLGTPMHGDARGESFYSWRCTRCQLSFTRTQARRGNRVSFEYGDQLVEEAAWKVLVKRGPKPWAELKQRDADVLHDLTDRLMADRLQALGLSAETAPVPEARPAPIEAADRLMASSSRPRQTAPRFIPRLSTPVDTSPDQKMLDEAERQGHIRVLSFCAMVHGLGSAWFRRREALDARLSYLKGATLDELREERQGRYGRWQLRHSLDVALLLARWRIAFRSLTVAE
ncbi:hypothetical protein Q0M94_02325 [Deinococcus radiomollis]|uniref:hypothetical protein n=1 Tax=Deinococcus radiomollis TaxID=468916 RepID=UPI00389129A9